MNPHFLQKMCPQMVVASSFMFSRQMLHVNLTSLSGLGGGSTKPGRSSGGNEGLGVSVRRLFTPCTKDVVYFNEPANTHKDR